MDNSIFIKCACGIEGINIDIFEDEVKLENETIKTKEFNFSIWNMGYKSTLTVIQKISYIWHIITKGTPYSDQIILRTEEVKTLIDYLNKEVNNG